MIENIQPVTEVKRQTLPIEEIIENELIETHFHPIISIKIKKTLGVEALSRGIDPRSGVLIPPALLFSEAANRGLSLELDRICRKVALRNFKKLHEKNPELFLFINLDTSILNKNVVGSGILWKSVSDLEINPKNVVIEIIESKVEDTNNLLTFIKTYKKTGFLIALDDVGAGHSNLDRISLLRPDIIKIDMMFVQGIHNDFYKQELVRHLVRLSHNIRSLVVVEGIEDEHDAITSLELGVDLLQGFYISKPLPAEHLESKDASILVNNIANDFQAHIKRCNTDRKSYFENISAIVDMMVEELCNTSKNDLNEHLGSFLDIFPDIECVYLLDETGIQVSDTICNFDPEKDVKNHLFHPAPCGTDHSLKNYFSFLHNTKQKRYITEPYISFASGNMCITVSRRFYTTEGELWILCIDLGCNSLVGNKDLFLSE
jgi:EAL domain-containing protein (putative c-di-GMP-specific phosphodiesterase class I)